MALVNCRESGKQISDQASACPNCGFPMSAGVNPTPGIPTPPPLGPSSDLNRAAPAAPVATSIPAPRPAPKKSGCGTFVMLGLVGLLVLLVLGYGMGPETKVATPSASRGTASQSGAASGHASDQSAAKATTVEVSAPELLAAAKDQARPTSERLANLTLILKNHAGSAQAKEADAMRPKLEAQLHAELNPIGLQWSYSTQQDDMSGKPVRTARVTSTNSFNFDFPYSGRQKAELTIRRHPRWGNDVMVSIEKGQILCHSFSSCPVRIRFDDESAKTFTGTEPSDNSSEMVFIPGYKTLTSKLGKAKRLRVEFNVYQQGSVMAEFDVSGFDAKRMTQ